MSDNAIVDDWPRQMRKGFAELCILIVLNDGEDYGYSILSKMAKIEALSFSESTLYPMLARMTKQGLLKVREGPSARGKTRRYYHMTTKAKVRLAELLAHWESLRDGIELLASPRQQPEEI